MAIYVHTDSETAMAAFLGSSPSVVYVSARNYLREVLVTEIVVCSRLDFWIDICSVPKGYLRKLE